MKKIFGKKKCADRTVIVKSVFSKLVNVSGFSAKEFFNYRGFNMFSAIVAIILIMTGVVLTNTLISTEEKTSRQIYSMLNNYQLSDAANLARADALQSFNYNFREKLENFLTFDDYKMQNESGFNLFMIKSSGQQFTFDSMKNTFESTMLSTEADADKKFDATLRYVADRTVDQFRGGTYGRFQVYLSDKSEGARTAIKDVVASAIAVQRENFLEVVGCSETECKDGSFYFKIPLNNISDELYESLPRIVVKDLVSQEEIKMAILPRTNIMVYIPLRFFKALNEARKTANSIMLAHNQLEQYKLGFCDGSPSGSAMCAPRTNPLIPQTQNAWDKICPSSGFDPPIDFEGITDIEKDKLGVSSYKAGGNDVGKAELDAFGAAEICKQALLPQGILGGNAFQTDDPTFIVKENFLDLGERRLTPIPGCGLNKLTVIVNPEATHRIDDGMNGKLVCGRITGVTADIVYAETDPKYIVKGTAEAGKKNYYKIRISDYSFVQANGNSFYDASLPLCHSEGTSANGSCKPG